MKYSDYLAHEQQTHHCGFCDVSDEHIVISNEVGYVTPALAPYGETHFLVCPWDHVESFLMMDDEARSSLMSLATQMMSRLYDRGVREVVQLMRDSQTFVDGESAASTSGKTRKHFHIHIVGDVQIMPAMTQVESDSRRVLTDEEMRARVQSMCEVGSE
jgi:diadenosine tetraphosphate (Ap4A) HIT family hydrolase